MSPGAGLKEQASKHLKLRWLKARVVSVTNMAGLMLLSSIYWRWMGWSGLPSF